MVLYAATHLAFACLEKMVHLERGTIPRKLRYAWAEIPAKPGALDPTRRFVRHSLGETAGIREQWLVHGHELGIRVPSALIPREDNVLLNPAHPDDEALQWNSL